jgi:hypothetical protein
MVRVLPTRMPLSSAASLLLTLLLVLLSAVLAERRAPCATIALSLQASVRGTARESPIRIDRL